MEYYTNDFDDGSDVDIEEGIEYEEGMSWAPLHIVNPSVASFSMDATVPSSTQGFIEELYLVFANQKNDGAGNSSSSANWKGLWNWLISFFTGPYTHVEPMFVFTDTAGVRFTRSFNVRAFRTVVEERDKDYTTSCVDWKYYQVPAQNKELWAMYNFCGEQVGKRFNYNGLASFYIPFAGGDTDGESWTCSQLTMRMLQLGGFNALKTYNFTKVSVYGMYKLCAGNSMFIANTPDVSAKMFENFVT